MYIVCVYKYNTSHISRHSVKKTSLHKSCVLLSVSHLQTWQARAGKVRDRKGWGGAEETVGLRKRVRSGGRPKGRTLAWNSGVSQSQYSLNSRGRPDGTRRRNCHFSV